MPFLPLSLKRTFVVATAVLPAILATGCANMVTTAPSLTPATSAATVSGQLHGGNQPITGSTITLYAAGSTTGYGLGAVQYARTTSASDAYGSFRFTKNATNTGIVNAAGSTYGCPAVGDPQMYLTAKGGNTQGQGSSSSNAAVAFVVALGKCSTITSSTFVNINEVTTVATLAALQQYFNPLTEAFGYPATTQAATGFANAYNTIALLANVASGAAVATSAPASAVAGVTVSAASESGKINLMANILASCVNTASSSSAACQALFTNAVPPPSAATTSQPTLVYTSATDTMQALYYMLTNPTESQDYGSTGKLANLYNLATGVASPFQPALSTQPQDWTLAITYTPAGTCTNTNAATFLASAESIAIDAGGNVWFNNGAAANDALGELSPTGSPAVCAFGTITTGRGLTIDTVGNVWTTGGSTTAGVYEYLVNGSTLNWPTTTAANGIASDGSGNIFFAPSITGTGSAGAFQEYIGAASANATTASVSVGGNITNNTGLLYLQADPTGRLFAAGASSATYYEIYPGGTSPINGYTSVDVGTVAVSAVTNNAYGTAIDSNNIIFGGNTCCASANSNTWFRITPAANTNIIGTTGTNSAKYLGGLVAPRSTAVDGAGNVWAGMGYPVITAVTGTNATPAVFALSEVNNALTVGISPNGITPATCSSSGSNCPTTGGFQKASLGTVRSLAIDPSGNVWAASNGAAQTIVEFVGAAVPVVTPLSTAAANNQLGTKP